MDITDCNSIENVMINYRIDILSNNARYIVSFGRADFDSLIEAGKLLDYYESITR